MTYTFYFENIDCPNCANRVEREISKIDDIKEVSIDFMTTMVKVVTHEIVNEEVLLKEINEASNRAEAGSVIKKNAENRSEEHACDCHEGHHHEHEEKQYIIPRILSALVLFGLSFFIPNEMVQMIILVITYIIIGFDVLLVATKNIVKGEIFDENFLMSLASIGAMIIGEYPEAVAVILFYQIGEYFQDKAVEQSRKSITELMDIRPDYANLLEGDATRKVNPETVEVNALILVKAGEKIPLDGIVLSGSSSLDVSALTGESLLREVEINDEVMSGSINKSGTLTIQVTKPFSQSTVSKILELVENASSNKSKSEKFITRFARYYTPIVVSIAIVIAFVIPLIVTGSFSYDYIQRALIFLVISCPCALVISVPLSFYGGIGGASKAGILFKGSNYIESLSKINTMVLDKTGTLTKGNFVVSEIITEGDKKELLEYAAYAEFHSTHPIGKSIVDSYGGTLDSNRLKEVVELEHLGMKVQLDKNTIIVGNKKLMEQEKIEAPNIESPLSKVYVARNGIYLGTLIISDEIKVDAKKAISDLHEIGINEVIMLTGDTKEIGEMVAKEIGMNQVYTEMYPQDKVDIVSQLSKEGKNVAFVGDGINDAPVLTIADVGIAMGGVGSDAAIEAADVILMDDQLGKLAKAIQIARKTMAIARQNIVFALGVKVIILILGALGIANMWMAVFADVGVSLLAIINAMRGLKS